MPQKEIVPIVTSVKMDDYLAVTIRNNRRLFERYYVLTSPEDEASIKLCRDFGAEAIVYDRFWNVPGSVFNKSGGIRHAQKLVHHRHRAKWVLLIDTDILLPEAMEFLDVSSFTKRWLYGMERRDAPTYEDYEAGRLQNYGTKFVGYFQMYFNKAALYDPASRDASYSDMAFRDKFPRRILLPDMHLIHVGRRNMHWGGRTRPRLEWGES